MGALDRLLADLRVIFASRLASLVVYGPHAAGRAAPGLPLHTLALVDDIGVADLDACARQARRWQAEGLAVPLMIGRREFARSLDVFPLEFGAIISSHRVVFGADPFHGLRLKDEDVRRACEIDVKGHVLHLREGYVESQADPSAVARLVEASAAALRTLVGNIARLDGQTPASTADLAAYLDVALGPVHGRTLSRVLALGSTPLQPSDAARSFPEYLAAAEALSWYVDAWS